MRLPTAGADTATHIRRLKEAQDVVPQHNTVTDAAADVSAHVKGLLGRLPPEKRATGPSYLARLNNGVRIIIRQAQTPW